MGEKRRGRRRKEEKGKEEEEEKRQKKKEESLFQMDIIIKFEFQIRKTIIFLRLGKFNSHYAQLCHFCVVLDI